MQSVKEIVKELKVFERNKVPDYVLVELIDPDTGEVLEWENGAKGEIVYTTIDREAIP